MTREQAFEISEILERRANEVMGFLNEYQKDPKHYGSVQLALSREIDRLYDLASVVRSPFVGREDEE